MNKYSMNNTGSYAGGKGGNCNKKKYSEINSFDTRRVNLLTVGIFLPYADIMIKAWTNWQAVFYITSDIIRAMSVVYLYERGLNNEVYVYKGAGGISPGS